MSESGRYHTKQIENQNKQLKKWLTIAISIGTILTGGIAALNKQSEFQMPPEANLSTSFLQLKVTTDAGIYFYCPTQKFPDGVELPATNGKLIVTFDTQHGDFFETNLKAQTSFGGEIKTPKGIIPGKINRNPDSEATSLGYYEKTDSERLHKRFNIQANFLGKDGKNVVELSGCTFRLEKKDMNKIIKN
jgi:hypothetical protein